MITLDLAKKALAAAEKKAEELKIQVSTVVVDEHGVPIAMSRMEDAFVISPDFALAKAFTAATLKMPSGALSGYAVEGKPYYGINTLFGGKITTIAGGVPVKEKEIDVVIGAVGVGGSPDPSQDELCAKEAVKVLEG